MADFRKILYAFGFVATLAVITVPASAQGLSCTELSATQQIVRVEGYTEQVGDIVLKCEATSNGVFTPAGQPVAAATVRVTIPGTSITSRKVGGNSLAGLPFSEALLMIDEPGKTPTSAPQVYCGKSGNDTGPSGRGVCQIIAPALPTSTYDGAIGIKNVAGVDAGCVLTSYACGRPNVYQGVQAADNVIEFPGVPLDPPLTNGVRIIRITNIRVNATVYDPTVIGGGPNAFINFEGAASVQLQNNQVHVADVLVGMGTTVVTSNYNYLQCIGVSNSGGQTVTIREGFRSSWKPRNNVLYILNDNDTGNNTTNSLNPFNYDTIGLPFNHSATNFSQNIPDVRYYTEGGFFNAAFGTENNIHLAGVADFGTRIYFHVDAPALGSTLTFPTTVYLNQGAGNTGVAKMTGFTEPGTGAYTAVSGTSFSIPSTGANLVYEILFADPFGIDRMQITPLVSYSPNLPSNQPAPGVITNVGTATFAPFYAAYNTSTALPRFKQTTGPVAPLYQVSKCSCNLLFPWVVSDTSFETGIVIANTSKDPGSTLGFSAQAQDGKVTFFYFGTAGVNSVTISTAAANPSTVVVAGNYVTHVVGVNTSAINGLTARPNFAGYVIAQSEFQYCHGIAQISSRAQGGQSSTASYLGLVLDGVQGASPLQRTNQQFKDALDQ